LSVTYLLAYLVLDRGWKTQAGFAALLLAVHWAIYNLLSPPGVTGPYDKDANVGWWLDGVIFGKHWGGGYATINCISSAANTIFGMMAGFWLRLQHPPSVLLRRFLVLGVVGTAVGLAMNPLIPINKKIWTASFAILSAGLTLLTLALFYWLCDMKLWRRWAHVFAVVGMNSIFIYLFHEMLYRWLRGAGFVFTGWAVNSWGVWGQAMNECLVVAFQIGVCFWLYRNRIFFKI